MKFRRFGTCGLIFTAWRVSEHQISWVLCLTQVTVTSGASSSVYWVLKSRYKSMNRGQTATQRVQSHICVGTCCTKHKSIYFNLLLGWYFDDQLHFSDSVQLLTRSSLRIKCDVEFVLWGNLKKCCRGVRKCKKRRRRRRETFRSAASEDKPLIPLRVLNELVSTDRCQVWRWNTFVSVSFVLLHVCLFEAGKIL